ncbi:MAG: hypothetical protein WCL61_02885 [bacterium]
MCKNALLFLFSLILIFSWFSAVIATKVIPSQSGTVTFVQSSDHELKFTPYFPKSERDPQPSLAVLPEEPVKINKIRHLPPSKIAYKAKTWADENREIPGFLTLPGPARNKDPCCQEARKLVVSTRT